MAAKNRRDIRSYRTPGVVDGNLARDLRNRELEQQLEHSGQLDFDKQYRQRQESEADRLSRRRQETRATVRQAQSVPVGSLLCGAVVAVLAVMVVGSHVRLNEISADIVSMKHEIAQLEIEQVALQTQYEQAFDLSSVKEVAEAAGMRQPSDGQIYYIDLPGEDLAVACNQTEESMLRRVFASVGQHIYSVLEYFL